MSTVKQLSAAIKRAKASKSYPLDSLKMSVNVKTPTLDDAFPTRQIELKDDDRTGLQVLQETMTSAISCCTGLSKSDAEYVLLITGSEHSEIGRDCLERCGCYVSIGILGLTKKPEIDSDTDEVFT